MTPSVFRDHHVAAGEAHRLVHGEAQRLRLGDVDGAGVAVQGGGAVALFHDRDRAGAVSPVSEMTPLLTSASLSSPCCTSYRSQGRESLPCRIARGSEALRGGFSFHFSFAVAADSGECHVRRRRAGDFDLC